MRILILVLLPNLLGGCVASSIASTAVGIVTLPVKVVSAGVDAATTSQSEADQKRGREVRKADEQRAKEERKRCKEFTERGERSPPALQQ